MKISCWNVNGIRACIKKGFWDWYKQNDADIVCLQETKITPKDFLKIEKEHNLIPLIQESETPDLFIDDTPLSHAPCALRPIFYAHATAQKPGYSGVLILSKTKPKSVTIGLGVEEFDNEGRTVFADYGKFMLVGTYVPNGGRELERIPFKIKYSDCLLEKLQEIRKTQKNIIICGDMNVAHQEIDIKNAKANENNSGFTKIERDWFTKFLSHDYIDTFRHLYPDAKDMYSWWSYRAGARKRNIGWRIDYFVVTKEMIKKVKEAGIQMKQLGSDHCPIDLIL